jgi:hypothetical protein
MKRIVALFLLLACVFSVSSCALVPAYNSDQIQKILVDDGYTLKDVDFENDDGVVGYIYASKESTGDELYYIYFDNFRSAKTMYDYINSKKKAKVAELKMEIERLEYSLFKAEGVTAAEKGDYYEQYINKTEELEAIEKYDTGRGFNVVWYGTKQAISDIRKG